MTSLGVHIADLVIAVDRQQFAAVRAEVVRVDVGGLGGDLAFGSGRVLGPFEQATGGLAVVIPLVGGDVVQEVLAVVAVVTR